MSWLFQPDQVTKDGKEEGGGGMSAINYLKLSEGVSYLMFIPTHYWTPDNSSLHFYNAHVIVQNANTIYIKLTVSLCYIQG